jgi:hypothetical protein
MIKDIPKCLGSTDYWGEFDCGYDTPVECEDCLCNYHRTGGLTHPNTGYEYSVRFAERMWGVPKFLSKEPSITILHKLDWKEVFGGNRS